MDIIGRAEEQSELRSCLTSPKPEFVVIYGRRRIGKTYLIKNFFDENFSFYASGTNNDTTKIQLKGFTNALRKYGLKQPGKIKDWIDAFEALKKLLESDNVYREPSSRKRIIFLDEVPWLDTKRSNFKAALDLFWNTYASTKNDLILIVCGSATSWIMKNMVKDEGGFYNRLTRKIHLLPFTLGECLLYSDYLKLNYQKKQIIDCYMVFGGVPYYWEMLNPSLSLAQNINRLCFKENGQLHDEYQALFKSLFSLKGKHREIIEALTKKRGGMQRKELSEVTSIGNGKSLTTTLEELCESGFVRAYDNYKTNKNGKFFQVVDSFVLFAKSFLLENKFNDWTSFVGTPAYYSWAGRSFEIVCLNNISAIKKALGISGVASKEYSWRSKKTKGGAQIDLLIQRRDMVINVCEMKYSLGEYAISEEYEEVLRNKLQSFREETKGHEQLALTLITFNGLKKNAYSDIVLFNINGDQLFEM